MAHFWKVRLFFAIFECSNTGNICPEPSVDLQQLVVASTEVLEKSQIFQKCAKCTLTLMSNYEITFDYKFRFYASKMNEICLHFHLLYFSSIILSFGKCNVRSLLSYYKYIVASNEDCLVSVLKDTWMQQHGIWFYVF